MQADVKPQGCTNLKLRQLSRRVTRHYDREVGTTGLKNTQYSLLSHVVLLGPIQPSELAARMQLDASTLTRNLKPLIAQGWIAVEAGADGRSRLLEATEAGRALRAEAQRAWKRAQLALNERLTPQRVVRLHALLDECLALLDEGPVNEADDSARVTPWTARDGVVVTIRPIRATDLVLEQAFVAGLSAATGYRRLMSGRRLSLEELQRFTDIDPDCEAALIALTVEHGREREVGVARYVKEACGDAAEFAIVISDDWQGRGLGAQLLKRLLDVARQRGVKHVFGTTLSDNHAMVALARRLGFRASRDPASAAVTNLTLELASTD